LLALLGQLHPRVVVISGCALVALAGMAAGVVWLNTLPPREQLMHLTGQLLELRLEDASTGAFKISMVSDGKQHTFHFDGAKRVIAMPSPERDHHGNIAVALSYFEVGRSKRVVDVVLGEKRLLSYQEVSTSTTEKLAKDRNSAIGIATMGALLIFFGGLARLVRGRSHGIAATNPDTTIGVVLWVLLYGTALVVMLTEPAILHRAFGTEAFDLPIEYILPAALAVLFLPLWPGFMGFASLTLRAMRKGRSGKLALFLEMGSALASGTPAERRSAIRTLWLLTYFVLLVVGWIVYAAMLGI
jgi:hypothetical protein